MIELKNCIPHPIKEGFSAQSDIWLSDCSFEKGKRYLLTAPSGKGKSTFLHIIYGLRNDFDGDVFLNDNSIQKFTLDNWAEYRQKELSIIFQNLRLFPNLSGYDNIKVKNQLTNHKSISEIETMAQQLEISDILDQSCGTMSYGQRQRVAIIRALCQPFSMLLLDEPFSHLDESNIKKACELVMNEVQQQKAGFILVSLGEKYFLEYDVEMIL